MNPNWKQIVRQHLAVLRLLPEREIEIIADPRKPDHCASRFPVTLSFSACHAWMGLAPLVAVLALAVFAFYTSLGGQKVFQGSLLED